MRKIIAILSIILLIGCSKNDSTTNDPVINGEDISTFQIVTIQHEGLSKDQYTGYIGDIEVTLLSSSETELVFSVPKSVELGEQILNIPDLQDLKIVYNITETTIAGTPEENMTTYFSGLNNYLESNQGSPNYEQTNTVISELNDIFSNSSDLDKITMAKHYKANKDFFDEILSDNMNYSKANLTNEQLLTRFGIATVACGVCAAVAILDPEPTTKMVSTGVAIVSLGYAFSYKSQLAARTICVLDVVIDGIVGDNLKNSQNQALEFTTDIESSLLLETRNRAMISSDENDDNENLMEYFSNHNKFNTIIGKLNTVIEFLNENIFFSNIDLLNPDIVNETNPLINLTADINYFNNIDLTLNHNDLTLDHVSFEDGNISITISVNNPSTADDVIESEINFSYGDSFNSFSGTIPIEVVTSNPVVGDWEFSTTRWNGLDDECLAWDRFPITFKPDGSVQFTAPGPWYNMSDYFEVYNYTFSNRTLVLELKTNNTDNGWEATFTIDNIGTLSTLYSGEFNFSGNSPWNGDPCGANAKTVFADKI